MAKRVGKHTIKFENPVFVKELSDETVYNIECVSSSKFVSTSNKKVSFFKWKNCL